MLIATFKDILIASIELRELTTKITEYATYNMLNGPGNVLKFQKGQLN